jgi:hypothetical protein
MSKKALLILFLTLFLSKNIEAQVPIIGDSLQLEIANWNLNWLGKIGYGPSNEKLQQANIIDVINKSEIDIWAFCEVSNNLVFDSMMQQLPEFAYSLCNYLPDQKIAIIYKKSLFKLLKSELLGTQQKDSFSTLRFPFQVTLKPLVPMGIDTLFLIALHLKANIGTSTELLNAYNSRIRSAQWLKMYLNQQHSKHFCMVLGDWNDDIDESIYNGLPSPFAPMLDLDFDFTFVTKTFSDNHIGTTTSYPEAIDHQFISKPLKAYYVSNSTKLFALNQYIPNYSSTTSDHYPVFSSFSRHSSTVFSSRTTQKPLVFINSSLNQLIITREDVEGQIKIYNMQGSCILDQPIIASQSLDISRLPKGYYMVSMIINQGIITQKIVLF